MSMYISATSRPSMPSSVISRTPGKSLDTSLYRLASGCVSMQRQGRCGHLYKSPSRG